LTTPAPTSDPDPPRIRLVPTDPTSASPPPPAAVADDEGLVESYRRLADVFHDVLSEQSPDALLERIADTLAALIPYDDMHIYEADEVKRELNPVLARSKKWAAEVMSDGNFPFGEGITGWACEHREPVLSNQAHLDPRVRFVPGTPIEPEALIVVPLLARGVLKGTLNVYREGEDAIFTNEEFELARRLGDAAALALDNAHIRASLELQAQTDSLTGLFNHRYFHERLRRELTSASTSHETVGVVMLDIDDFKRVNDIYGHAVGDQILAELADHLRATVRGTDVVCRIGGEEFAVIVPATDTASTTTLATRLARRLEDVDFLLTGKVTVSIGIAHGPEHAMNPRELVACAESAMMTAKASGKSQMVVYGDRSAERPAEIVDRRKEDLRSIAHLKMLQSLGNKLNRLNDVREIGMAIANELRGLIDYHNCRVFMREGDELIPIAFRGELTATRGSEFEVLATRVGYGITGRVAETGVSILAGDASKLEFAQTIPGTEDIEESVLAVPLTHGSRTNGVIFVSKLGVDQFDADDQRLLEVLGGHAAIALENAALYEAQRREAEAATALLEFSRELTSAEAEQDVLALIAEGVGRLLGAPHASVWLQRPDTGELEGRAAWSRDGAWLDAVLGRRLPAAAALFIADRETPFVVGPEDYAALVEQPSAVQSPGTFGVAPFAIDGRWGALAVATGADDRLGERELALLGGLAYQAQLAITNASRFESLEHTFLSTVEALANALEANDEYTSSHARWITDLAMRVGARLGLDARALKRVELGALFHDIGKIGIPASILAKPGPLTDEERRIVETHPELGERILRPIGQLEDVCAIVRSCHERWDGRGYPDRKAAEEIPIESRIIFACDAFHAMTTDRPYRRALPAEEAVRRLREAAGSQFDPRVVDACLSELDNAPTT
jgi:diguanylate cyclase (GGDEF)-like protein